MRLALTVGLCAFACLTLAASSARGDRNDLTLERIIGPPATPGMFNDPTDPARQTMYKSLMSELGVVIAPRALSPADTLGYSGFQLGVRDVASRRSRTTQDFWKKGVENVSGELSADAERDGAQGHLAAAARVRDRRRRHQAPRQQPVRRAGLRQAGAARRLPRLGHPVAGGARRRVASAGHGAGRSHRHQRRRHGVEVVRHRRHRHARSLRRRRRAARHRARAGHRHHAGHRRVRRRRQLERHQRQHDVPRSRHDRALAHLRRLPPGLRVPRAHRRVRLHVLQQHGEQLRQDRIRCKITDRSGGQAQINFSGSFVF